MRDLLRVTRVIAVRPAGSTIKLQGAGDRLPWSPGPGAIPSEEPLLPRLETAIGMLATLHYAKRSSTTGGGAQNTCTDWCTCSLEPATRLLGVSQKARITGPFLVARIRYLSGGTDVRVYINAATGLLDTEGIDKWVMAAELIAKAAESTYPRTRLSLESEAADLVRELMNREGIPLFIPAESLLWRATKIALSYEKKYVKHGMMYSIAEIDLLGGLRTALANRAIVESVYIVVLVTCNELRAENLRYSLTYTATLGPRGAPVIVSIENPNENIRVSEDSKYSIALTPAPAVNEADLAIHPYPPQPPMELYTRAFKQDNKDFRKDVPIPAYWPGTVLKNYEDPETCPDKAKLIYTLKDRELTELGKALKRFFSSYQMH